MNEQPAIQLTEKYQVLPDMPPEQIEALKADIAERGVLVPIDVDVGGMSGGGRV